MEERSFTLAETSGWEMCSSGTLQPFARFGEISKMVEKSRNSRIQACKKKKNKGKEFN